MSLYAPNYKLEFSNVAFESSERRRQNPFPVSGVRRQIM
jgi:hypothetical protein